MDFHSLKDQVTDEIKTALSQVDQEDVERFVRALLKAEKIFVIGVRRVMLMMEAFAKRIKHLGLDSHVVGEITEPPISDRDVLVTGSSSGETTITVDITRIAKKYGAKVALITSSKDSTLKKLSDISVRIPCPTKLRLPDEPISKQPLGNLFEQSLLLFCDCVAMMLQEQLGLKDEDMRKAHANLE